MFPWDSAHAKTLKTTALSFFKSLLATHLQHVLFSLLDVPWEGKRVFDFSQMFGLIPVAL